MDLEADGKLFVLVCNTTLLPPVRNGVVAWYKFQKGALRST